MSDLENLSREELLALVKKQQVKIDDQAITISQQEKTITKQERKLAKREAENQSLREEIEKLRAIKKAIEPLIVEALTNMHSIAEQTRKHLFNLEDYITAELSEQCRFYLQESMKWIKEAHSALMQTPFVRTGKDLPDTPSRHNESSDGQAANNDAATDETKKPEGENTANEKDQQDNGSKDKLEKQLNDLVEQTRDCKSLKNNLTKLTRLCKALGLVIEKTSKNEVKILRPGYEAASKIIEIKVPEEKEKNKNSKGRQKKKEKKGRTIHSKFKDKKCPECGNDLVSIAELREKVYKVLALGQQQLEATKNIHDVYLCKKCKSVFVSISPFQNVPVVPNREISCELCINVATGTFLGIPINRQISLIKVINQVGNDTIYYSFEKFVDIYLDPLYKIILTESRKEQVLVVDETPFPCLPAQGKKNDAVVIEKIKNGEEHETHSSNYILAITSTKYAEVRFCLYSFIESRALKSIESELKQFDVKALITDAYPAYASIVAGSEGQVAHQSCLVHFRREVIKSCLSKGLLDELDKLSDDELIAKLTADIEQDSVVWKLTAVIAGIGKIAAFEAQVSQPGQEQQRLELRQGPVRALMDNIDTIMNEAAEGRVSQMKSGRYEARGADPYAKPCVYYLNNRDRLRAFLDDPRLEPWTNTVELCVRPLTVLRKNINWAGSYKGAGNICKVYSVFSTARRNGITDVPAYLRDYSHALYEYCVNKRYTAKYREEEEDCDFSKQIRDWDMEKLSEGFDFASWSPFRQGKKYTV